MTKKSKSQIKDDIENYLITGYYYQEQGRNFRKYLNIKNKASAKDTPDLMVIMMNPGSSKPIDNNDNGRIETEAVADPTQAQIIRIMESSNLQYARVINLSDRREAQSYKFYTQINEMNALGIEHSIFHNNRQQDFNELFVRNIPVVYAWGVNKKLHELAKIAIRATNTENTFGWKKPKLDFAYYHPFPRKTSSRIEWYETLSRQLRDFYS